MNLFFKIESILESVKNTRKMSYQVYSTKKKNSFKLITWRDDWKGKKLYKNAAEQNIIFYKTTTK